MKDRVLIADDDPDVISALRYLLELEGYSISCARTRAEVSNLLRMETFDLLLTDLNFSQDTTSGKEGLELILDAKKLDDGLSIVVMTAWGSIETAVEAMQNGARDFIQKPWKNDRLISVIRNQILLSKTEKHAQKLEEENLLLRKQIDPENQRLRFRSETMTHLLDQIHQVAQSDASVLFTGENGTGKSHLARQLHRLSPRKEQAFISVNMGSISESLFESEMFGHVKGAFTDARKDRIGRFELAEKGSLFLDEIGNTPLSQQVKLLRVLEENQFEKVGASRTQRSDCRLISATNCDLDDAVAAGDFRKDLLYRVNTVTLRVPSLRERVEDILPLAEFFLDSYKKKYNKPSTTLSDEAADFLMGHSWPGNIRELSHVMERAIILSKSEEVQVSELGIGAESSRQPGDATRLPTSNGTLEDIEKAIFQERLRHYEGNGMKAAQSLGLSKSAFYRRQEKYKL